MNKFSIFNFLFVCVTQWRSIVLNCVQNFCLLSMVSVISWRPKKKKKKIVGFRKTFFIALLLATHADVKLLWLNFEMRFAFSVFLLESTLSCNSLRLPAKSLSMKQKWQCIQKNDLAKSPKICVHFTALVKMFCRQQVQNFQMFAICVSPSKSNNFQL